MYSIGKDEKSRRKKGKGKGKERENGGKVFFENGVGLYWLGWAVRQIEFQIEGTRLSQIQAKLSSAQDKPTQQ